MTRRNKRNGFTLIELIVIITLIGIVGGFLVNFMSTSVKNAPDVALIAGREARTEQVMERIIADYLVLINGADPDTALATIVNKKSTYEALDASGETKVDFSYITFNASGTEVAGSATDPTLKVTVTTNNQNNTQNTLITLLSKARTTAGAANEDAVNFLGAMMRNQEGFTLIEMIIVMVIMGVLLTAGSLFVVTMIRGLIVSRNAVEIGQSTQLSMDRIVYELKHAKNRTAQGSVGFTDDSLIIYETTESILPGTRTLQLAGGNLELVVDTGTPASHVLLQNVNNFNMNATESDVDGDPANGNEISRINISFQVTGYGGTFSIEVSPRMFIYKASP